MKATVDNDVLLKAACYGLLDELLLPICGDPHFVGVLGQARYVLEKKISRRKLTTGSTVALKLLALFLSRVALLEPTSNEQSMAADLELAAQRNGVNLDSGESQLRAIVVHRSVPLLLTGDKRAIRAIEVLLDIDSRLHLLRGRVVCLEQLVLRSLTVNESAIRNRICAEPDVDKALTICFSCTAKEVTHESVSEGLASYIQDLRTNAVRTLAP